MRKETFYILLVFLTSAILRFWKLGDVPAGLDINEINLGLITSKTLGDWFLNPFWIRFLFAIAGTAEVLLLYFLIRRISENYKFSLITSGILAIFPWHIHLSRTYSIELLGFGIFLIVLFIFSNFLLKIGTKTVLLTIFLGMVLFAGSVLQISENTKIKVDSLRNVTDKVGVVDRVFTNKLSVSFRERQRLLFENLDFGNYFFRGYPRERWGVEEIQKFYFVFLPLMIVGLFKLKKQLLGLVVFSSILSFISSILFPVSSNSNIILLFPAVILASSGIVSLVHKRILLGLVATLLFFELIFFLANYFSGNLESQFSPRRFVYKDVAQTIFSNVQSGERVLVSDKLENFPSYLEFYNRGNFDHMFEFKSFDIRKEENKDKLFIDTLPDDAPPDNPLYTQDGKWPYHIGAIAQFYDKIKRQTIVIYRYM